MTKLVIIDFWAEWCGPCKALSPVLEKVAADYADKGVLLAKIDTDANQFIAAQFQIKSIPTVYAMFQGQLVADLTTARTESQLKAMLDQILTQLPVDSAEAQTEAEIEPLIAMGEQVLAEGDAERALSVFDQIAEIAPDAPEVVSGRVRALIARAGWMRPMPRSPRCPTTSPRRRNRPRARRARPGALGAAGRRPRAADRRRRGRSRRIFRRASTSPTRRWRRASATPRPIRCSSIVAKDRDWNEGAARAQFLKLLEVVGLEDPWVSGQRRRLSAILFT